ncbi:MAG: DNA-protecting protein DprA [Burkholderiales bacterium]|nr:DNA-protecting protein DprA [Burkholderiales bacterium]
MERDELGAWLRLTLTPGIGNDSARRLLAALGLPALIFEQDAAALQQLLKPSQAQALLEPPKDLPALLDSTWAWLQEAPQTRALVALGDARYPAALLNIEDPPLLLYLMGRLDLPLDTSRSLAMVGSRNPTPQGALNARQFAQALGQAGLTIVSGLALGVDGAAHEGALAGHAQAPDRLATVAVVGTGLDRVYPKGHRELAHRICEHGLLISEYPLGTPPLAANFPRRNRLIAGLSSATLVVEAALQSGSLITARLAAEQGKDVFAIPGSIHATQSHGCHALIRQGAKLVESAQDILEEFPGGSTPLKLAAPHHDATEDGVLQAMGLDPVSLDALQARTGLDIAPLQARLMALELDGQVARLPGGLLQRLVRA